MPDDRPARLSRTQRVAAAARIRDRAAAGCTDQQIAAELGLRWAQVAGIRARFDIPAGQPRPVLTLNPVEAGQVWQEKSTGRRLWIASVDGVCARTVLAGSGRRSRHDVSHLQRRFELVEAGAARPGPIPAQVRVGQVWARRWTMPGRRVHVTAVAGDLAFLAPCGPGKRSTSAVGPLRQRFRLVAVPGPCACSAVDGSSAIALEAADA